MSNTNIPDSPTILQNGTGTPYLAIFNGSQQPIIDPKNNLPIGVFVTSFEYSYIEEDCDEGTILIETDNPDIVTLEDLDYYRPLQLQWGYIFPSNVTYRGPIRKVMITGREVTFDETGVHVTLTVSDASVILKNIGAQYFNTSGFVEYIKDILEGNGIGIIMTDYRETSIKQQVVFQQTISNEELINNYSDYVNKYGQAYQDNPIVFSGENHPGSNNLNSVYFTLGVPSRTFDKVVGVKVLEATSTNLELAENYPEWFRTANIELGSAYNLTLKGINPNKYGQAKEIFSWAKNGPYFLDGRDNMLQVHNQLVNRPISKVYTFAGGNGELLQFRVGSEFTTTVVGVNKTMELTEDKQMRGVIDQAVNHSDSLPKADMFVPWGEGMKHNPEQGYNMGTNSRDIDANSWNGDIGKYSQPGWSVTVPEGFYEDDPTTKEPIASDSALMVYTSRQAAEEDLTNGLKLTQEEVARFWAERKEAFNQCLQNANIYNGGPVNPDDLGNAIHEFENLGNLVIHRKCKIRAMVDVRYYADPENQELMNEVLSGKIDMAGNIDYPENRIQANNASPWTNPFTNTKKGFEFLKSIQGITVRTDPAAQKEIRARISQYNDYYGRRDGGNIALVEYIADFEIPVDGTRVIANYPYEWAQSTFPTQMEQHVKDQTEATATVIGDPCLESSMNILIRNVSSRYSGIWYTKKVTHRFSVGLGYKCSIEFKQRTTDVIVNQATCTIDMKSLYANLQKIAQEVLKEGKSYGDNENNTLNQWNNQVIEEYNKNEKTSMIVTLIGGNPNNVVVQKAEESFVYSHPYDEEGKVDLIYPSSSAGDPSDPYYNSNSDGAQNTQNS